MKKRFKVYVTEARPYGLGIKTDAILRSNGIESRVILDSSVAFIMGKVDAVFVGSEGVCESGGVVNFVSSFFQVFLLWMCRTDGWGSVIGLDG